MLFMANNSKLVNSNEDSSFQQMLTLINKISGKQPNLRIDIQNLKLNVANRRLTVNSDIDIKLPPLGSPNSKKEKPP